MSRDDWDDERSSFDRVLESIDAIVHRHPSAGPERAPIEQPVTKQLPDNVVDLRARFAAARSGGYPDDAA